MVALGVVQATEVQECQWTQSIWLCKNINSIADDSKTMCETGSISTKNLQYNSCQTYKKESLFYRAEDWLHEVQFSYYEEYVYPEGVTSGDNIPPFGNESVETSFHWLMRRKMNWLTPASSSFSSGESSASHKRQLPCADARLVWFALSALPEQWVAGNLCRCIRSCGGVIWENSTSQEDAQSSGSFHAPLT